jgi:hypothetical protein
MLTDEERGRLLREDTKYGTRSIGRPEYRMFLQGKHITHKQRLLANCYYCCTGYFDGHVDCGVEVCPAHNTMPYRSVRDPGGLPVGCVDPYDAGTGSTTRHTKRNPVDGRFKARKTSHLKTATVGRSA